MNSWNNSTSLAYNLKVYNVIDKDLQNKVYEMMNVDDFYDEINELIYDFDHKWDYEWQAGFNGRSGGYLVLYKGGKRDGQIYSLPGKNVEEYEVPTDVKKAFRQLALDIVKNVEWMAKNMNIGEEVYECKRKALVEV